MAPKPQPWTFFFEFALVFVSVVHLSSCQTYSSQNIETFYPFSITPSPSPAPAPSPSFSPPAVTPQSPPSSSPPPVQQPAHSKSSTRRTIVTAVAATAAATLLFSLLLFLLLQRCAAARNKGKENGDRASSLPGSRYPAADGEFARFDDKLEGFIVDENGLDVIYHRNSGDILRKQVLLNLQNARAQEEEEEGERERFDGDGRRGPGPSPEVPFVRGKSSTSHAKVFQDPDRVNSPPLSPPPGRSLDYSIGETRTPTSSSDVQVQPPMPPPPPIVPPSQSFLAVHESRLPPPPPPPIPAKKNPAAPPPPPPKAGELKSSLNLPPPPLKGKPGGKAGESSSSAEEDKNKGNGQVKFKPLHWDKVNTNADHSMVWNNLDKGSFRFDADLMEALFGSVATNRRSPQRNRKELSVSNAGSGAQTFILDPRKSQNIAIVLKSLTLSRAELLDAVMDGQGLDTDTLEKLSRIAPTQEEQAQILEYSGDPLKLADAESFLFHILKAVPAAFTRLSAMLFRSNYNTEILHLKDSLETLELASKELRTRGLFMKLLEAVLKAGNRMNAGTARGNAQAFNLSSLRKLSDVKSTDGKTTLLHFVVEEVIRSEGKKCAANKSHSLSRSSSRSSTSSRGSESSISKEEKFREYMMLGLPIVGGLSAEFANVKKAATIDYDTFAGTCSALAAKTSEIQQLVSQCEKDGGTYVKEMKGFLQAAEKELKVVREEQAKVMELVKKTTEYYQPGAYKDKGEHPIQLFVIVKDFLGMVDQACVEIARNVQRRKASTAGSGSASPRTPPLAISERFPNLPDHFMSDKSRSTSSDSGDDDS